MAFKTGKALLVGILLLCAISATATAYETPDSIAAAGKVYVSSTTFDPGVFFPGDTGTVTYVVTNGNNNSGIVINHATVTDKNFKLQSKTYDSSVNIGPGQSQTFTFGVLADGTEGMYYPEFSLSFRDADSLFSRTMVKIDSTPLVLTVVDQPDAYSAGKKKTIYLQVANPRENDVNSVTVNIAGDSLTSTPSKIFVGTLKSSEKDLVNFSVTPDQPTTATVTLTYNNGDNPHVVTLNIPIQFGVDKKTANPVMSNVQVKLDQGIYHVTGDVNNAGLETANTVMVTSLDPAMPQDPYKSYVVGALKPDDFGSFEVTFSAINSTSVPLQLSYKDADGNIYNTNQDVKISANAGQTADPAPVGGLLVIVAVVVILAVFAAGWALYLRRAKK